MDFKDTIKTRRSIRRFKQEHIDHDELVSLIDCARLAPSGSNFQPLEYVIVEDTGNCKRIFEHIKWAAYIAPAGNPPEGFRPVAYIIVVVNRSIRENNYEYDVGAAVQTILLSAHAIGIGSCWIRNFKQNDIRKIIEAPEHIIPDTVIALGYPAEESKIEILVDSHKYYKDKEGKMHVPKRSLISILHNEKF